MRSTALLVLPVLCVLDPFSCLGAAARSQRLADLNEPVEISLTNVIASPAPPVELKAFLNGKAADWVTTQIDWTGGRILLRLLGDPGDPNAGAHARLVRQMLKSSRSGDKLSLCVKSGNVPARSEDIEVSVQAYSPWDLLWITILLAAVMLPLFIPKLLVTRVRDWNGNVTGEQRFSLTALIFYAWNFAVLIAAAYVRARTGEWTVNSTALALVGLGSTVRGGAKFVHGSRLTPVAAQPLASGNPAAARAPAPQVPATADPTKPGPAAQPAATPPTARPGQEPSPDVLSLFQPLLRIFSQTLTDAEGAAMHRIQCAGWNAILLVWYLRAAYLDWALPSFDMSLLGISTISGAFHVASKPAEQILRSNVSPAVRPFSFRHAAKSVKLAFSKETKTAKRAMTTVGGARIFLLVFLLLSGAPQGAAAAQKVAVKKDAGGADKQAAAKLPTGTAPADTPKSAASDKPQDREWKLVNQPAMLFDDGAFELSTRPPHIPVKSAKALMASIIKLGNVRPDPGRTACSDTVPWVIQTMVFGKEAAAPARVETVLYSRKNEPREQKDLLRTRIHGSKSVCFVQLVYSSIAVDEKSGEILRDPANISADFVPIPALPPDGAREPEETGKRRIFVWKAHASAAQFYAAKKKTAAPFQDLKALVLLGVGQAGRETKTATAQRWLVSANLVDSLPEPSDIWVQAGRVESEYNPTAFTPLSTEVQFDNEGYYWYDFSVTFPLNSVNALEYNENDSTVQTKQVDLKTIYATANVFLWKSDIKDPSSLWTPRLLFGIGIRGRPFDRMFVGAGFGLNKLIHWAPLQAVQPFGGLSFNRVYQKEGSGTSAVVRGRTIHKLAVGINIPVKSVVDRLKAK